MSYLDSAAEETFFARQKEFVRRLCVPGPLCVFDVGANVGQSIAAYRGLFPDCRITSFEPQPRSFAELSAVYGTTPGVTLEQLALAEAAGDREFHSTRAPTASSLLRPDERIRRKSLSGNYDYEVIRVRTETLDRYCEARGISAIDIMKIDVQGAELDVLKGAGGLLSAGRVRMLYLEVIFADNYQGQSDVASLASFLAARGYVFWDIRPFLFTRAGRLWTANAMFMSSATAHALEQCADEFPS